MGWQISLFLFYSINNPTTVLWLGRINFVFAQFIAFTLLVFCFLFPSKTYQGKRKLFIILTAITLFLAGATLFSPLLIEDEIILGPLERETVFGMLYPFFVLHFMSHTFGGMALLVDKLKQLKGVQRQQTIYLLIGFLLSIIFGSLTNIFLPLLLKVYDFQQAGLFAPLIFVAFASYAIIKHRLLDIRLLLARTISYSFVVLILATSYSLGLFLVGSLILPGTTTLNNLIPSTILALIMAYTFQPIRRLVEEATDSVFYRGRYDTQELIKELNKLLVSTYLVKDLLQNISEKIQEQVKVKDIDVVLFKDFKVELHYSLSEGKKRDESAYTYQKLALLKKYSNQKEIIFEDLEEGSAKDLLRELDIKVVYPLKTKDNFIGFLMLGDKLSGNIYSKQDIELFELFAPELSLALQNAKAFDEISKFNITLKKKIEEATSDLKQANEQLKELDQLKDDFVSIASHELRTPMTAIKSYLWMVLDGKSGPISDKQKKYLERSYQSTEHLIKMVNNMLDVSRIESGRMILDAAQTNLRGICLEVVSEYEPRAKELGLELKLETEPEAQKENKYLVAANSDKIKDVIINLVGNSLKFTPEGGAITILLKEKNDQVIVSVKDTGVGISQESQEHLFEKFGFIKGSYRTNQDASMGSGLGLYICKSIIEMHGGEIWVESEGKNSGTTFSFSLPTYSRKTLNRLKSNSHNIK